MILLINNKNRQPRGGTENLRRNVKVIFDLGYFVLEIIGNSNHLDLNALGG